MSKAHTTSSATLPKCRKCGSPTEMGETFCSQCCSPTSSAHTPAPWRVEKNDSSINPQNDSKENYYIAATRKNGDLVCIATLEDYPYNMRLYYEPTHKANAELIAQAPTLKAENQKLKESNAELLKAAMELLEVIAQEKNTKESNETIKNAGRVIQRAKA